MVLAQCAKEAFGNHLIWIVVGRWLTIVLIRLVKTRLGKVGEIDQLE